MKTITAKFGGSSLASAAQFRKVGAILAADPARRFVVASTLMGSLPPSGSI